LVAMNCWFFATADEKLVLIHDVQSYTYKSASPAVTALVARFEPVDAS
jgi:hypothetical protein